MNRCVIRDMCCCFKHYVIVIIRLGEARFCVVCVGRGGGGGGSWSHGGIRTGVIWQGVHVMRRAAEFCTRWNLAISSFGSP